MTRTKDEALKLAKAWFERNTYGDEAVEVYEAIEQALAAPVQEPEIVQRVKRYAGQTMRTARNPNITARECIELANWIVATHPAAQPAPVQPVDIATLVEGMEVSIDVSTGEHDSGNRLFGTVTLAQENQGSKHGLILLVQDPEANFNAATPHAQPAVPDALTSADIQEHIEYVAGWNDCRAAMLEILKARGNT
jgi:hypothetical protein